MARSALFSIVVLIIGLALLMWGFNASESVASEVSETFQGAPTNKAIVLMVIGAVIAAVGAIGLFRRGR
jgi:hypothetical protein